MWALVIIAASRDGALVIDEPVAASSSRWTHLVLLVFLIVPTQLRIFILLHKNHVTHDISCILYPLLPALLPNGGSAGLAGSGARGRCGCRAGRRTNKRGCRVPLLSDPYPISLSLLPPHQHRVVPKKLHVRDRRRYDPVPVRERGDAICEEERLIVEREQRPLLGQKGTDWNL